VTVRAELLIELFRRCRAERPDIQWVEGYPGDSPERERVWPFEIEGPIIYPVGSTQFVEDDFTVTFHGMSETGGQSRADAITNVEAYLTTVLSVIQATPDLGGEIDPGLATTPVSMNGPYSEPNTVEPGGFTGMGALVVRFESRPN
jgi:hypothetical protein